MRQLEHKKNPQNTKIAEKVWFTSFLTLRQKLNLRQPELIPFDRGPGFNTVAVHTFFLFVVEYCDWIYNYGHEDFQYGLNLAHSRAASWENDTTKRQTSGWRRLVRTRTECNWSLCSNRGWFLCPANTDLSHEKYGAFHVEHPEALSSVVRSKARWNYEVFCEWKHHFISVVKPMPQEKRLLLVDGQSSQTLSVVTIEIPRKRGIAMLSLPSHSTHRTQSLDVTFFRPLSTYIASAIAARLRETRAATVDRTHGVSKGCNEGNGYELVQE
jgi:hypothetical protein